MATLAPNPPAESRAATPAVAWRAALPALTLAALLAAILVVLLPAFVCMPLDADVSLWDLFARTVSAGGVAYKDLQDNNFPGMLWAHLAVRSLFGWRSE